VTASAAHVTVLLEEAVEALAIRAEGVYLDATFGRGGHSRRILDRLNEKGRLLAVDRDPMAIAVGRAINDPRFHLAHRAFGEIAGAAHDAGMPGVDGVLFDIGVSSPQINDGERGFSFRHDAPLDMRMDTTRGETAAEWLARAETREITEVIRSYGEERFAFQIAKKVVAARLEQPVVTTGQFAAIVRSAVRTREPGQDAATRSFQALRIHINQELDQLALALPQAARTAETGGPAGGDFLPFARGPHRQEFHARRSRRPTALPKGSCRCAPTSCRSPSCGWSVRPSRPSAAEVGCQSAGAQCGDAGGRESL
jgi:16S rRNA (cytosine1402-N4)-methyltransferase